MSSYRHKTITSINNNTENTKENEVKNNAGAGANLRELPKTNFNSNLFKRSEKTHKIHILDGNRGELPSKKLSPSQANTAGFSNQNLTSTRDFEKRNSHYKTLQSGQFKVYQEDPFIKSNENLTDDTDFKSSFDNEFKFPATAKLGVKPLNKVRDFRGDYLNGKGELKKDSFAAPIGGVSRKIIDYEKLLSLPENTKIDRAKQPVLGNVRAASVANTRPIYNNELKKSIQIPGLTGLHKDIAPTKYDSKPISKPQIRADKPIAVKKQEAYRTVDLSSGCSTPKVESSTSSKSNIRRPSPSTLRAASSDIKQISELLDRDTIYKVKSDLALVDREESKDPTMEVTYAADIIKNWVEYEPTVLPLPNFLENQPDISMEMRAEQINWMIGFLTGGPFHSESLHIAINVMDRVLSNNTLTETKLHCLAITSLFMALKVEEVQVPSLEVILANALEPVSMDDVIKCEIFIVMGLEGDFNYPSPLIFLRRYSKADDYDVRARTIAKYFIDLCLFDYEVSQHRPSIIAASSLYLAQYILGRRSWTPKHVYLSNYGEKQLMPFVKTIISILAQEEVPSTKLEEKFKQSDDYDTGNLCRQFIKAKKTQLNTKPVGKVVN
jgi:hypothetical protein